MTTFTYRTARSGSFVGGVALAIIVESLALHLWLGTRHPVIAWALSLASVSTIVWLVADYRALGVGALQLTSDTLELSIGRRGSARIPRGLVAAVIRPTWRDIPTRGTPAASGYVNLLKPATPNVLVTLTAPVPVPLMGGLHRPARQFGLRLDDADAFIAAWAMRD